MLALLRKGSLVGILKLVGALSGLAFTLAVAWGFGAASGTDALFAAMVLPVGVWQATVFIVAQVSVPYLIGCADGDTNDEADFLGQMSLWIALIGGAAMALSVFVPGLLLAVVAPGLSAATKAEAIGFLRALAPVFPLTLLAGLLTGLLYARQRFFVAEVAQLLWKFAPLAVLAFPATRTLAALAWATSVGAALRLALLFVALDPASRRDLVPRRAYRAAVPVFLRSLFKTEGALMGCDWVLQILCNALASTLSPGALSLFNYADRTARTAPVLLMRGIGVVLLPTLSRRIRSDGDRGWAFIHKLLAPLGGFGLAIGGLAFLFAPLLAQIFALTGKMPPDQVETFAAVVRGFAAGLPATILVMGLQTGFFLNLSKTPLLISNGAQMLVVACVWWALPNRDPAQLAWLLAASLVVRLAVLYGFFRSAGAASQRIVPQAERPKT